MKDLVASRIKIGDEQAFELLFHKYFVRLCCFANKFLNDPEESRDVVQQVFLKLWEFREHIDPDNSLNSYLYKITQNTCVNRLQRRKVESKYTEIYKLIYVDHCEAPQYESIQLTELEKHLGIAMKKIPPKCKRIFELSRIDGLKYVEIAETLNISIKTVEAHMSKAFQILRVELREYLKILLIIICLSN